MILCKRIRRGMFKRSGFLSLVIDEPDAKIVRKIFEMRANGKSLSAPR